MPTNDVIIVGGGVIGLSIAYVLAREGVRSVLLDRRELGRQLSTFAIEGVAAQTREPAPQERLGFRASEEGEVGPAGRGTLRPRKRRRELQGHDEIESRESGASEPAQ